MKVWITKYALTKGIYEVEGEVSDGMLCVCHGWYSCHGWYRSYFYGDGKDWHRTKDAAIVKAKSLRDAKVAALRKQIAKLEAMTFDV